MVIEASELTESEHYTINTYPNADEYAEMYMGPSGKHHTSSLQQKRPRGTTIGDAGSDCELMTLPEIHLLYRVNALDR